VEVKEGKEEKEEKGNEEERRGRADEHAPSNESRPPSLCLVSLSSFSRFSVFLFFSTCLVFLPPLGKQYVSRTQSRAGILSILAGEDLA
jgi:hypothetical protein